MITLKPHPKFLDFQNRISDPIAKAAVAARLARLQMGRAGDFKPVGDGVNELRIDVGAGWRVYYKKVGNQIILLLGGGTKKTQQQDIDEAKRRVNDIKV